METTPRFWSSDELIGIAIDGVKDLWRDIVDLKGEHYLTISTDVTMPASSNALIGVPTDVHKVYLIEPQSNASGETNQGLVFQPTDYNHPLFQSARTRAAVDPSNEVIYYAITGAGAPVDAPTIRVAPQVTSAVALSFSYVPTLPTLSADSHVPIPGEADSALVAWTVAFARAKEREDRSPDPNWLQIYATEKEHLLQSLGLRQLQEPSYVDAIFQHFW